MSEFNTLDDFDFKNKFVLFRADINCPLNKDTLEIEDANRVHQVMPTLKELLAKGAKVAILSHQGRPGDWDFAPLNCHTKMIERILAERIAPSGGRIRIPDRPGLGLVLDDVAVERFAIR